MKEPIGNTAKKIINESKYPIKTRKDIYAETLRKQKAKRNEIIGRKNINNNRKTVYSQTLKNQKAKNNISNKKPVGNTAKRILAKSNPRMNNNTMITHSKKRPIGNTAKKILSEERTGYIYCIVDRNNVARYIGQTVRSPVTRFNEHMNGATDPTSSSYNTQFSQAIRTYGINNFSLLILESEIPESNLDSKEKAYIEHYNTFTGGYNGTRGGGRVKTPQVTQYIPPTKYTSHNTYRQSIVKCINCGAEITKYGITDAIYTCANCGTTFKNVINIQNHTVSSNNLQNDYNSSDDNEMCIIGCCLGVFIIFIIMIILGSI